MGSSSRWRWLLLQLLLCLHLLTSPASAAASSAAASEQPQQRPRLMLIEESPVGSHVGQPLAALLPASGACVGGANRRVFSFSSEPLNPFLTDRLSLAASNGQLTVAKRVDREELLCGRLPSGGGRECCRADENECTLTLNVRVACVGAGTSGSDMQLVDVALVIKDVNDNQPTFPEPGAVFEDRAENLPPSSEQAYIYLPLATDLDSSPFGIASYSLRESPGLTSNRFFKLVHASQALNPSRRLYLEPKQPLDHEEAAFHFLQVVAVERSPSIAPPTGRGPSNILNVSISVRDENDNPPIFTRKNYSIELSEGTPADGRTVLEVNATDRDSGPYGQLRFELTLLQTQSGGAQGTAAAASGLEEDNPFALSYSANMASIVLMRPLDFERTREYHFILTARDISDVPKSAEVAVDVRVTNENDNPPVIKFEYKNSSMRVLEVDENQHEPTLLAHIVVEDPDWISPAEHRRIECVVEPRDRFELVPKPASEKMQYSVQTVRARPFDRERDAHVPLAIRCTDPNAPALVGEVHATVNVNDVNDNPPVFENSTYLLRIAENNDPNTPILEAHANDADIGENARVEYYLLQSDRTQFSINAADGRLFTLHSFDRERTPRYELRIYARNTAKSGFTATATVSIEVLDLNDNAPALPPVVEFTVEENTRAHALVGKLQAVDPDLGENGQVEYSLADPNAEGSSAFQVGHSSGELHLKRALDREQTEMHEFRVVASDLGTPKLSTTTTVRVHVRNINDNAPEITDPKENENPAFRVNAKAIENIVIGKVVANDKDDPPNDPKLVYSIARVTLDGKDVTRFGYFVLNSRNGDLSVGAAFPANPSSGASQDSSRAGGYQSRGDSSFYLQDNYLLEVRVNDSADGGAFAHGAAHSVSRRFFVRVEYGAAGAIVPLRDEHVTSGGLVDALSRLLASHGLVVLLVLGLACLLLVVLVGSLLLLYRTHAAGSSPRDRSKRGSTDEEDEPHEGLWHSCIACLLCLRCPTCCCCRRRRQKSPVALQQAAEQTGVALVSLDGEHVARTKTPALERASREFTEGVRAYRGVSADDSSSSAAQDEMQLPYYGGVAHQQQHQQHQHRRRRHGRAAAEMRDPVDAVPRPEETCTENSNYADQNTSHGGSEADDSHNYAEYAELSETGFGHPSLRRTNSARSAGGGAMQSKKAVLPGTFAGRVHRGHRQRRSTRDGPARSFQQPDIPEGGSSIERGSADGMPGAEQMVSCEVHDPSRANHRSGGANNNYSESLSQAAESELQSFGVGMDLQNRGQTPSHIPQAMRASAFSPYHMAVLQDPNSIRPYHTTFATQPLDQNLLKPIAQRAGDTLYGVNPMFLSGVAVPQQQFAYSPAAMQLPVPMPALYSEIPNDPRGMRLALQQQQQMQGSMHAAFQLQGGQSLGSGQPGAAVGSQAIPLPLHAVPMMAANAAHNMQQLPMTTDTLQQQQPQLFAYCFGAGGQPNQQSAQREMASPSVRSQLRTEDNLRSATASPARTLPPRERVYGIVKGSRV